MCDGHWIGIVISQPIDIVEGQNGLVVPVLMRGPLMEHESHNLVGGIVDMFSVF